MVEQRLAMRRQRELIDLLLKEGIITPAILQDAREESRRTGLRIERVLEKIGAVTHEDIVRVQANALGLPYMDLTDYIIDKDLTRLIPKEIVKKHRCVPLFKIGDTLTVGMADPQDVVALDQIRKVSGMRIVEPVMVSDQGIDKILDTFYSEEEDIQLLIKRIKGEGGERPAAVQADETAPVVKLVNLILRQAVRDRVSDIHIEPEAQQVRIRCRIDGLLRETVVLPKEIQESVISRIKVLADLDIAESRRPQDGRFRQSFEDRELDVRVSTFPTLHGENVVLRLLDKSSIVMGLADIGMGEEDRRRYERIIHAPNGIILVTGPTGSGKTSTLYTTLTAINSIEKNIITIEDPVEYELPLIRQTQVNPKAGITFAAGLRSILRQDPDVIMVGEIRDRETVEVAIQAALTGHLVFATLHTNDAAAGLTRLIDMGVEPFLVASSVIGIVAQRLVRLICPKCRETYPAPAALLRDLGLDQGESVMFSRGKGCPRCHDSGYHGRTGIFEILVVNDDIRKAVEMKKSADDIKTLAIRQGMTTLREDGVRKILAGLTTPEEVLRVTETEKD